MESGALGGTCVNVGCVPKKVMVHAADLRESFAQMPFYGFGEHGAPLPSLDMRRLKDGRDAYVRKLNGIYARNLEGSGVHRLEGWASGAKTGGFDVTAADGSVQQVRAKHVLLAPGGKPVLPPIPGRELAMDSDGFFDLEEVPESVVVVGAGYIGVELAGVLAALGSRVTLVHRGGQLLRGFDAPIADVLLSEMRASGVEIRLNEEVTGVKGEDGATALGGRKTVTLSSTGETVEAAAVLFATGRRPSTEGLAAEGSGVEIDGAGYIGVGPRQETGAEGVYAVGDATRGAALTPVAIAAGRLLADRLFGGKPDAAFDGRDIPTVVFSHPPIGTIGRTEEEAVAEFGRDGVVVHQSKFRSLYYGIVPDDAGSHKPWTMMRLVCHRAEGSAPGDERVVGVHMIGRGVDEVLQGVAVAVRMGATKRDFDSAVAIHPTSAEELVTMQPWEPRYRA